MTTHFTVDLNAGLTQVLSDGTNTYLYGIGRIAQESTSGKQYFLADALGSVRQLVDSNGSVQMVKSYEPYGEVLNSAGNGVSNYGFTGEWADSYIKLIYLRSRMYSLTLYFFHGYTGIPVYSTLTIDSTPDFYLEDRDALAEFGFDARVIALPGHSAGSIGILAPVGALSIGSSPALFCGDLLDNTRHPVPNSIMDDSLAANASPQKLRDLQIGTDSPGHGQPFPAQLLPQVA